MNSKLVAITQRVTYSANGGRRSDSLDQAWFEFSQTLDVELLIIPNRLRNPAAFVASFGVTSVVLSGGNNISRTARMIDGGINARVPAMDDVAPERDETEFALLTESIRRKWSVIGVCRGMQMLNVFYGGSLSPVAGHVNTRHAIRVSPLLGGTNGETITHDEVNSFHNFGIFPSDLAPDLISWGTSQETIEAVRHKTLAHFGIMWHPERETVFAPRDIALFKHVFSIGA